MFFCMNLNTESPNSNTTNISELNTSEFVNLFIQEDKAVWRALEQAQKQIASVIDKLTEQFNKNDFLSSFNPQNPEPYFGPRIFYVGAGTSGRLGVLDSVECLPTFSTHPDMFQGIIAGGKEAMFRAVEGAEDNERAGFEIIDTLSNTKDIVIGISASGSAPYVIGALQAAQQKGCVTVAIANNPNAKIFNIASSNILLDTGSEILSGSTRLKAGSSQKICLNIISTGLMIKLGKTYKNLMVDLQATNAKLLTRAKNLTQIITNASDQEVSSALATSNFRVKHAVLKILKNFNFEESEKILKKNKGFLSRCIDS
jgi:N-acetylmuramic acid 6-phosphate etherase